MSTDRKRLSSAIQRIAEQSPDIRQAIKATKPRGDQASAAGVGTSDAERDRVCCDGSVSDNANPGTEERDTSGGGQDAGSGLNPDDPADISNMGPGSLTGLHDCATGEPVCFEGADWVPPDGWDSPTQPGIDPTYVEGSYYKLTKGASTSVVSYSATSLCSEAYQYVSDRQDTLGGTIEEYRPFDDNICGWILRGSGALADPNAHVQVYECGDSSSSYCNPSDDDLTPDSWPEDSCINLAIKGGSIVGSKYDPENDGSYSKPMSEIELCDDFGNSFFLRPSAGGGWKTINATKDAGYLWGSNGQKIAHINGNEYSDPDV